MKTYIISRGPGPAVLSGQIHGLDYTSL